MKLENDQVFNMLYEEEFNKIPYIFRFGLAGIGLWFEQRAFKKASNLANMIFLSERHKVEMRFQEWKMKNRSF